MQIIWECFVNLIEVILFYLFVNQKLHKQNCIFHLKEKQFLFLFFRFLTVCFMNQTKINSICTLTFSCIMEILFACLFYRDKLFAKVFTGLLFTVLCMFSEFIPFFCLTVFSNIPSGDFLESGAFRMPITALYLTLIAVFVFLFRYILISETSASVPQRIIYTLISLSGIAIGQYILLTMLSAREYGNEEICLHLSYIDLAFMLLFVALLLFIYRLGVSHNDTQQLLELQATRVLEEQEYKNTMEKIAALRDMKHDMDTHLDVLAIMAKKESSIEMLDYIDNLRTTLNYSKIFLSTGNMAVDCVLSSKLTLAKEVNIQTEYSVFLPEKFDMDAVSVCSMLGNLWDNAIEACKRKLEAKSSENVSISFYIKPYLEMTIIHIENDFIGKINCRADGSIQTSKNTPGHGIGLKKIVNIVNQEHGILTVDVRGERFIVHILLPQKGAQT